MIFVLQTALVQDFQKDFSFQSIYRSQSWKGSSGKIKKHQQRTPSPLLMVDASKNMTQKVSNYDL